MTIMNASKQLRAIIYQTSTEESIPEPALVVSRYSDVIEILQDDNSILLNPETVPELAKVLKAAMKEPTE